MSKSAFDKIMNVANAAAGASSSGSSGSNANSSAPTGKNSSNQYNTGSSTTSASGRNSKAFQYAMNLAKAASSPSKYVGKINATNFSTVFSSYINSVNKLMRSYGSNTGRYEQTPENLKYVSDVFDLQTSLQTFVDDNQDLFDEDTLNDIKTVFDANTTFLGMANNKITSTPEVSDTAQAKLNLDKAQTAYDNSGILGKFSAGKDLKQAQKDYYVNSTDIYKETDNLETQRAAIEEQQAALEKQAKELSNYTGAEYYTKLFEYMNAQDEFNTNVNSYNEQANRISDSMDQPTNVGTLLKGIDIKAGNTAARDVAAVGAALFGKGTLADEIGSLFRITINDLGGNVDETGNLADDFYNARQSALERSELEYAPNAQSSKVAEMVDKYGTMVWSQAPSMLLALLSGGTTAAVNTAEDLSLISSFNTSSKASQLAQASANTLSTLAKNPQYWNSFIMETGSAYNEALEDGFTKDEARIYAVTYGTLAATVEMSGGIELLPKNIQKYLERGDFIGAVLTYSKTIADEVLEEESQDFISKTVKSVYQPTEFYSTTDEDALINPKRIGDTALDTAITTVAMGGIETAATKVVQDSSAYEGNAQELLNYAKYAAEGSDAKAYAEKLQAVLNNKGSITNRQARSFDKTLKEGIDQGDSDTISKYIQDFAATAGETEDVSTTSKAIADDVVKAYKKGKTIDEAVADIKKKYNLSDAMAEAVNSLSSEYQIGVDENLAAKAEAFDKSHQLGSNTTYPRRFGSKMVTDFVSKTVDPTAQKITTESGNIGNFEKLVVDNGAVKAQVKSGDTTETVNVSAMNDESQQLYNGLLGEIAADPAHATASELADVADAFNAYNSNQDIDEYIDSFSMVRNMYGKGGISDQYLSKSKVAGKLTESQKIKAYKQGLTARSAETKAKQAGSTANAAFNKKARVDYGKNGQLRSKVSKENQNYLEFIARSLGVDIVLFESTADERGNLSGIQGKYEDGKIYVDVYADINNINDFNKSHAIIARVLSHEVTHYFEQRSPVQYHKLANFVLNILASENSTDIETLVMDKMDRAKKDPDRTTRLTYEGALKEVVADGCETMLTQSKYIRQLAKQDKKLFSQVKQRVDAFLDKIRSRIDPKHEEAKLLSNYADELSKRWDDCVKYAQNPTLTAAEQEFVDKLGSNVEVTDNDRGQFKTATTDNTIVYSERTYNEGGREALIKALKSNGHSEQEINDTVAQVDDALDYLKYLAAEMMRDEGYDKLANHLEATIVTNIKTGKQVLSTLVSNGEYPVNLDLALICKKRVAYMNVMNRLITDGVFDSILYDATSIAEVNNILRENGYETACLGCFVESRRLQLQAWAETICSEWNDEVDQRVKNAGDFNFSKGSNETLTEEDINSLVVELSAAGRKNAQGNLNLGTGNIKAKMGRLLDKVPSMAKHLTTADLLTPKGLTALRQYDSSLFSLVKSRYGANSPKIVQEFNPYNGEVARLTFGYAKAMTTKAIKGSGSYTNQAKAKLGPDATKAQIDDEAMRMYLYDNGGARLQSFSDFMIENVFDQLQIFADLAAKRFPGHGYTKEQICLRLFGMTGFKWNGSLIAHVDPSKGKAMAGLMDASEAKNGNAILVQYNGKDYAIGFDDVSRNIRTNGKSFIQSIGFKDIVALQLDPRYSANVGSITIGVSDAQIAAMLDSPYFRMVIPYHKSGMNPVYAQLMGTEYYNDYEEFQNTAYGELFDTNKNPVAALDGDYHADTFYAYNAEVQRCNGNAKLAADHYIEWCNELHPVYTGQGNGKKLVGYMKFKPRFSYIQHESNGPITDFSKHENYYKLLEDFNTYDSITNEAALQGSVELILPSKDNALQGEQLEAYKQRLKDTGMYSDKEIDKYAKKAQMDFKELVAEEVKGRADYENRQAPKWESTVKQIEDTLTTQHSKAAAEVQEDTTSVEDNKTVYSERETDPETLKFLNDQLEKGEVVHTYKTFLEIDGKLYPPMASMQKDENGKRKMAHALVIGEWEKSVGNTKNLKIDPKTGKGYYDLIKDNGKVVRAAYNPYQHSSNLMINDQFEEAYKRPNLVTYECVIPMSELTSGYQAQYAKDPVGRHSWKAGVVAGKLTSTKRDVYLSRWLMPIRKVSNAEVAQHYKDLIGNDNIAVPFNVVGPELLSELEKIGVNVDYDGSPMYKAHHKKESNVQYSLREIVGESGTNYGIGVYLDSTLLTNLTDSERIEMVKERVKELGGKSFTAINPNGDSVSVNIAKPSKTFVNSKGKRVKVNKDLVNKNNKKYIKQESVVLIDEIITASKYDTDNAAKHAHGWLDNYGKNNWEKWITYVEDKNNTIWEATLHVATSSNGDKYLYDIDPIKEVERARKLATTTTNGKISQPGAKSQELSEREDADYMAVVNSKDTAKAQEMVQAAATANGYTIQGYHGSPTVGITTFDRSKAGSNTESWQDKAIWFTNDKDFADTFAIEQKQSSFTSFISVATGKIGKTYGAYIKPGKIFDFSNLTDEDYQVLYDGSHFSKGMSFDDFKKRVDETLAAGNHQFAKIDLNYDLLAERGYNTIIARLYTNYEVEHGKGQFDRSTPTAEAVEYGILNPSSIKSADPIVKDDNGNVIPLSQRFNDQSSDIRYSEREAEAERIFGTTDDFRQAGYILTDGKMLKFTDNDHPDERSIDHRAIGLAYGKSVDLSYHNGFNEESEVDLADFVEHGAIRLEPGYEQLGFGPAVQLSSYVPLTLEQQETLKDFINYKVKFNKDYRANPNEDWLTNDEDTFVVSFGGDGSTPLGFDLDMTKKFDSWNVNYLSYVNGEINADRIISDIMNYYKTGKVEQNKSVVAQFHTSYSERDDSRTDREMLVDALETMDISDEERSNLEEYRSKIDSLNMLDEELETEMDKLRKLQKSDPFGEDTKKQRQKVYGLQKKINNADKALLNLQNAKPLKDVLERSKRIARAETAQRVKEYSETRHNIKRYRDRVFSLWTDLVKMGVENTDKNHLPEFAKEPIMNFLNSLDFSSKRKLEGGEDTKKDLKIGEKLKDLADVLDQQQRYITDPEGFDGDPTTFIDLPLGFTDEMKKLAKNIESITSGATDISTDPINLMNVSQLKDLAFVLQVLKSSVKKINTFATESHFAGVQEAATQSVEYIDNLGSISSFASDQVGKQVDNFFQWANATPYYVFRRFGEGGVERFNAIMNGWSKMAMNVRTTLDFVHNTYTEKEVKEWESKRNYFIIDDATEVVMTDAQIMSLYCLMKRQQAMGHIMAGGIRIGNIESNIAKKENAINQVQSTHYTIDKLNEIVSTLSDRQIAVCDALQLYMNTTCSAWGNEVSMERFGYRAFTESTYFPIQTDDNTRPAVDPEKKDNGFFRLLNISATKALTPRANNALVLSSIFDVFADHTADMAKYNGLALPILDVLKWYNFQNKVWDSNNFLTAKSVQKSVEFAFGSQGKRYFTNFVKDLNGIKEGGRNEDVISGLLSNYKIAAVSANLRVIVQQPTSIVRAATVIDPKYLAVGMATKGGIAEAMRYSGIAVWKDLGYFDTNIARNMRDQIKHNENWRDKVSDVAMKGAEWGDKLTWGAIWNAAKAEVKDTQHLTGDLLMQETAKRFNEIIISTQVLDSTISRSDLMRSRSLAISQYSSFMSEPTLSYNILLDAKMGLSLDARQYGGYANAWRKNGNDKKVVRALGVFLASQAVTSMAAAIIDAIRDDDEYMTFWEKWWSHAKENFANNINPLSLLPVISQIYDVLTEGSADNMALSGLKQIGDAYRIGVELAMVKSGKQDDYTKTTYYGNITSWGFAYKILQAISSNTGIPVASASREAVALYNLTIGNMTGNKILTYKGGDKKNISTAYTEGYLTMDEAMQELIDKGVAKDKDEAYWMIDAWDKGYTDSSDKYNDLFAAILSGDEDAYTDEFERITDNGIEPSTVRNTIKNQIQEWYEGDEDGNRVITDKTIAKDLLTKYAGLIPMEADDDIKEWTCEISSPEHIAFDDIQSNFQDSVITDTRAAEMLSTYGDYTPAEAKAKVLEWSCYKNEGISYDNIQDAFIHGDIEDTEAIRLLTTYNKSITTDAANEKVKEWQLAIDKGIKYNSSEYGIKAAVVRGEISRSEAEIILSEFNDPDKARLYSYQYEFAKNTGYSWSNVSEAYKNGAVTEKELLNYELNCNESTHGSEVLAQKYVEVVKWQAVVPNFNMDCYDRYVKSQKYIDAADLSNADVEAVIDIYNNSSSSYDDNGNTITNSRAKDCAEMILEYGKANGLTSNQMTCLMEFIYAYKTVKKVKLW